MAHSWAFFPIRSPQGRLCVRSVGFPTEERIPSSLLYDKLYDILIHFKKKGRCFIGYVIQIIAVNVFH